MEFLKKYGSGIGLEYLTVLNITSLWKVEMESKIKKINQIHKDIIKYYKEYIDLYDLVHELLKYESELQYLKLLYENKKYNEELEIVMEHNVEELL